MRRLALVALWSALGACGGSGSTISPVADIGSLDDAGDGGTADAAPDAAPDAPSRACADFPRKKVPTIEGSYSEPWGSCRPRSFETLESFDDPLFKPADHSATALPDGQVLYIGGEGPDVERPNVDARIYDPKTRQWRYLPGGGPRPTPDHVFPLGLSRHAATLLDDCTVLVCGGNTLKEDATASCWILDPANGALRRAAYMLSPRYRHRMMRLRDGRVLVIGGNGDAYAATPMVEVYDPRADRWTNVDVPEDLRDEYLEPHVTVMLDDGRVLFTGGTRPRACGRVIVFDPSTDAWTETAKLPTAAWAPSDGAVLPDGRVLVFGGEYCQKSDAYGARSDAALYDPSSGSWSVAASMIHAHSSSWSGSSTGHVVLACGSLVAFGGVGRDGAQVPTWERYDSTSNAWFELPDRQVMLNRDRAVDLADGSLLLSFPLRLGGGTSSLVLWR
jgi:N-acetylneuraminic acid mutarotase